MANKIGIVLALDGEQKFTAGLRSASQSAKNAKNELKRMQTEMKGSANTAESLAKKHEALKKAQESYQRVLTAAKTGQSNARKAYQEQAQALQKLSTEYEDAVKAVKAMEDAGKTSTDEYRKAKEQAEGLAKAVDQQSANYLRAEQRLGAWDDKVAAAESDLRAVDTELKKNEQYMEEASKSADGCATSIDKMGDEAHDAAGQMDEGGQSLKDFLMYTAGNLAADALKKVGEAALDAAKYVIDVGSTFEASMSKVAALSGASTSELAEMEAVAKQLGSTTRFSASEVADGFSYMALAGWSAQQSIDAIPGILDLAAASEMDLAEASDMVTDYLSAFGMEAKDATKMADMMAYAQANSNTSTQQLGDAFGNCAANMHAAGQDMQTTTAVLEAFANQGVKGSEAGTKLSAIMRDITAKMKDGAIQIGDTSVAVTDADGNFRDLTDILADVEAATDGMGNAERAAALSTTFTSRSVGGLNMILTEGTDKIKGYKEELGKADGAASDMATTMQDNLAGKVTEFNSALEGLGIQLYGYFSGPLKGAVSLATSLISGITKLITPQKNEIDKLVDSVKSNNKEVQALLDKSDQALANAQSDISEIDTAAEILRSFNEEYGLFIESDPSETSSKISEALGEIETAAENAGEDLGTVADADLSGLDGNVSEHSKTIDGSLQTIEDASTDAKDAIDGEKGLDSADLSGLVGTADEQAGSIEGSLGDIESASSDAKKAIDGAGGLDEADLSGLQETASTTAETIGETFEGVDGVSETTAQKLNDVRDQYIKTADDIRMKEIDPVALIRVQGAIDTLKSKGIDLSEYWDEENGKLNISLTQFESLIDQRKNAIIQSAIDEIEANEQAALIKSEANYRLAQSTAKAAQEAIDNAAQAAGFEKTANGIWVKKDPWGANIEFSDTSVEGADHLVTSLDNANQALEETGEEFQAAQEHADAMAGVVADLRDEYKYVGDETQTVAENTSNLGTSFSQTSDEAEGLEEELDKLGISEEKVAEKMEKARKTASQAIKDAVEDAKEAAKSAFNINPFEAWEKNTEHGMKSFAEAMEAQINAMNDYASNLQTVSEHVGQEITPEFLQYLQDMGEDGAQLLDEIAKEFAEGGDPSKVEAIVKQYTEAMNAQEEIANVMALNELAYKLGIKEFASSDAEWREVQDKFNSLWEGHETQMTDELENLVVLAKKMGVAIPEGFTEALDAYDEHPTEAVEAAMDILQAAIEGHQDGIIEAAKECGIEVPQEIIDGINSGGAKAQQAWADLVSLITGAEVDTSGATETGDEIGGALAESVENTSGEAQAAGDTVAQAATTAIGTAVDGFKSAGTLAGVSFATAITNYGDRINSAANARATAAAQAAGSHSSEFTSAGTSMGSAYAGGVSSVDTYTAGQTLASNAVSGATSVDTSGAYSVGANIGSGINQGISDWIGTIVNTAVSAVNQAVAGAKEAAGIHSPSRVFKEQIGAMIAKGIAEGIKENTGDVKDAAEAQMNQTLFALRQWIVQNRVEIRKTGTTYAEAVAYGWQELAKQQLDKNFGISKTKTTGSGDNAKTENKSPEELAQEVYRAAQTYLKNVQTMYDVSDAETEQYWRNVRKHLTEGTQAWYDATEQIKRSVEAQTEARRKAEEEEAQKAEERRKKELEKIEKHDSELLSRAQKYLEQKKIISDVSPDYEIKYWEKIQARMKKGSDEWYEVTKKLKELRAEQAEDAQRALEEEQERQKEQEEYLAQHDARLLTNAESYLDKKKTLNNVSIRYEITYWEKIRARMKEGSDEWYEVTKKLNQLQKQQADEQAAAYTKILTDAQTYIQRRKSLDRMTVQQEIQYWESVIKQLKKGTKEYRDALTSLYQAQKNVGTVGTASSLLDTYQTYYEVSARAEMQYWAEIRKHYKKGTEERLQADKQYMQARKNYYSQLTKMDSDYYENRNDLIKERDEEIAQLRQKYADQVAAYTETKEQAILNAQEKRAQEIKKINDQLSKDIADVRTKMNEDIAAANKSYTDAVQARQKELAGAFDLFAVFESSSQSGKDLLYNLQTQVAGYKDWMQTMQQLQKRGILSQDLIAELQGKGPESSAAIHALMQLSDRELKAYNDAYLQKMALAEKQAKSENTGLLEATRDEIRQIRAVAKEEIAGLRADAAADRKAANDTANEEIRAARKEFSENVSALKKSTNESIRAAKDETSKKLTELKSTYTSERKALTQSINSDILGLAKNIKSIASDQTASLTSSFTSAVNRLAGSGSNVGKADTSGAKQIKTAKKNAVGNRQIRDFFAWMDELGIGSEMIIRQDGARLNTNVRPGDAIVPAVSTKNLWNWSKLDPEELINSLRSQQATLNQYISTMTSGVASLASLNAKALTMEAGSAAGAGNGALAQMMSGVFALLQEYMPYVAEQKTISVDGRALVGATAGYMSEELAMRSRRQR